MDIVSPSTDVGSGPGSTASEPPTRTTILRFRDGPPVSITTGERVVVLDGAWTPAPEVASPAVISVRDVARRIMAERDAFEAASDLLDGWVEASGIVRATAVDGVSFWYGVRLHHWQWLVDRLLWLDIVDGLLAAEPTIEAVEVEPGSDAGLIEVVGWIRDRDGLAGSRGPADGGPGPGITKPRSPSAAPERPATRRASLPRRLWWRLRPPIPDRHRRILRRIARLRADGTGRLVVVQAHRPQRIDLPAGARWMNVYLDPIVDVLRTSRLDPIEVDLRSGPDEPLREGPWLPQDTLVAVGRGIEAEPSRIRAEAIVAAVEADRTPLMTHGIDLAPALRGQLADRLRRTLPGRLVAAERIRRLLRELRPAAILLADEYHRQDWLAAAAAERVPVAAVQHGVIYRHHTGYIHRSRPADLRLPERTYVFGSWERDLLLQASVYRPDEVVVAGSPRLDLVGPQAEADGGGRDADRAAVRTELGVAEGARLVVLSGTWGPIYRRFHYPIALADLFGGPLDRVHVVVKLHPSEPDEGPYRAIIERLAAAGGFAPPTVTTVQRIDLYRLLAAADAHLGIHSTLLTEAVVTGTPNLLAAGLAGDDLIGYVAAGVAIPVRRPQDVAAALDRPRVTILRDDDRAAFLAIHFEPGSASRRIADDLLAWLP
jgi:hypothetical protein